jgi:selenide,water dikinase
MNTVDGLSAERRLSLLFDPQTSGGLCSIVGADRVDEVLQQLREAGYVDAAVIGTIEHSGSSEQMPSEPFIRLVN